MAKKESEVRDFVEKVKIPDKVDAELDKNAVTLKGESGEVKRDFSSKKITIEKKDDAIVLKADKPNKMRKKLIKTYAAHIRNMMKGASEGHKYVLKICSGHFPMNVAISNNDIVVKNFLGEKVPRTLKLKEGAVVKVDGDKIVVESASKEIAGQISADIETLTTRRGYDSRIFQDGIYIINKDGKEII